MTTYTLTNLGTLTLGRTTFRVEEQAFEDGIDSRIWLYGPRGGCYFLQEVGLTDTGLREVVSFKTGQPLRDRSQRPVRVYHLGNVIELA